MSSKEDLLRILSGDKIGKVPWTPFLTYWWDKNADSLSRNKSEAEFIRDEGCGLLMRGHCDRPDAKTYTDLYAFSWNWGDVLVEEREIENKRTIKYRTKVGCLTEVYSYSTHGDTWFLTEHPVKTYEDYDILDYIIQAIKIEDNWTVYEDEAKKNPDALFLPIITPLNKTGFQSMIEHWVGTEEMAYALADYPEQVEKVLNSMYQLSKKSAEVSAKSPAEAFISWEDTSTTNVSPSWYKNYILPEINMWCEILHKKNKFYIQHACGHLKALLPLIAESSIDAIESVSDPPTGNITAIEVSKYLPERITVIGGIEATNFYRMSKEELEELTENTLNSVSGRRFILANSDSCPPQVPMNRFSIVSNIVKKFYTEKNML